MSDRGPQKKRVKAGLEPQELRFKAEEILKTENCCLLVGDIIQSEFHHGFPDRANQQKAYIEAVQNFNKLWDQQMPLNNLRTSQIERGVTVFSGDALCFGIDNIEWIERLQSHLSRTLPSTRFRWEIARDWTDKQAFKIC